MLVPTDKKIEVKDYPYGRLRTSMFFWVEFSPKHGYRSVRQSINPKTGRINKPKKSTYYKIMLLDYTDGFCKTIVKEFYHVEKLNDTCQWIAQNWELFTTEQRKKLYEDLLMFMRVEASAICTYCGADPKQVLPILDATVKLSVEGIKNPDVCLFDKVALDVGALLACKVEGYQPFKVTHHGIAGQTDE